MQKIHFSIFIDAPKEKVWNTMLDDVTYREWSKPFGDPGSYYEGSWEQGAEIFFYAVESKSGMYSRIMENRAYDYISIQHVGLVLDGVIDTESDEAKKWTPAFENYTFTATEGGTELSVDIDTLEEHREMFEASWPTALQLLKALAEK